MRGVENMSTQGYSRTLARHLLLAALLCGVVLSWAPWANTPLHAQTLRPQVLVLHSYHQGLSWTDNITRAIQDVLDPEKVDLHLEYMDTKRFNDPAWAEALYQLYRVHYAKKHFDVIIASDNFAFDFLRTYGDRLFPGVPVVFCGVNFFNITMVQNHPNFTGVVEDVDFVGTLNAALRLQPNLKHILVINDRTLTGQKVRAEFEQEIAPFADRLHFEIYDDFTLGELLQKLDTMPVEDTAILLILLNQDRAGQVFTYEEAIDAIAPHARVPMYGVWDFYLGRGIVGGLLTNGYAQGEAAARLARRILDGEAVTSIPIEMSSPNRYIFDYQVLQRYQLPLGRLPAEAEIINRPPTIWQRYRNQVLLAGGIMLVALLIVGLQARELRRRQQMEAELRVANQALQATQASLEARVQERTRMLEERSRLTVTAAQIGRDLMGLADPDRFWQEVLRLLQERLGWEHGAIFLLDEAIGRLVAQVQAGESTSLISLALTQGLVGRVARANRPEVVYEPTQDGDYTPEEALEACAVALVLPLRLRGRLVGVVELATRRLPPQVEVYPEILQPVLEQASLLWSNLNLLRDSQRALAELERLIGEQALTAWQRSLRELRVTFGYAGGTVIRLTSSSARQAFLEQKDPTRRLDVPLVLRGQMLGYLALERPKDAPAWTEEERAMAQTVAEQTALALDNARLLAETRARAARESTIAEVTARLRASADVERVLQTTIRELGRVLNATGVIRLGSDEDFED